VRTTAPSHLPQTPRCTTVPFPWVIVLGVYKQKIKMPMQRCDNMALLDASIKIENATEVCLVGWIPSIV